MLSLFPVSAFATDVGDFDPSRFTKSELDLSEYTLDDLMNMSNEEYCELVRDFERVYDPFDSYEESLALDEVSQVNVGSEEISPQWTSGDYSVVTKEYTTVGCHGGITVVAYSILNNDIGSFANSALSEVAFVLSLSLASVLPDKEPLERFQLFRGHFYDPDTNKKYAGFSNNTAKTNAVKHYEKALEYAEDGDTESMIEHLGKCLHFVQDSNEPHHAANIDALDINYGASHGEFEDYAESVFDEAMEGFDSLESNSYTIANNLSVEQIVHTGAILAKVKINKVNGVQNGEWFETTQYCMQNATKYSTMILYKFAQEDAVTFYYN